MSVNQSRGDKNEYPSQYKKSNRSANSSSQRNFSGNKGGAAAGSNTSSSNKSFKKVNSHAQGVQTRVNSPNTNAESVNTSATGGAKVLNGVHSQQPARGPSGAPATGANIKPSHVSNEKITPGLPRAPQGNAGVPAAEATGLSTPTKDQVDASKGFSLQFGSISPSLMNGMQVPARTSSAPPNFDEHKQAQALHEPLKSVKAPPPAVPKQELPRKDAGSVDQPKANEVHLIPKPKKDVQTMPSLATLPQKLSGPPIPGVPMQAQIPFHHPQLHVQYGGLNPQMQSQGMTNIPLPIPLPMGSPPQVQQPVFVAGIQHHPMQQPQGIIHQGPSLNFPAQIGPPQMPPQLGSMGIGLGQHYPQQQTGKPTAHRKTVKITHPDTHEELRLDGGSKGPGLRSTHSHGMSQSQAISSFPSSHPMNYYPNPVFFQPPSNPLASTQTTHVSQPPRLYSQVTVKPAANAPEKVIDSASIIDKDKLHKTPIDHKTSTGLSTIASKPSNVTQSENSSVSASSNVEDEVAKGPIVSRSGSFKEKKAQSTPLDQEVGHLEVLMTSNPVMATEEEASEASKKVAAVDFTVSKGKEGLKCTETSDVQEPIAEAVGSDDRKEDVRNNEPEQHRIVTSTSDQSMSEHKLLTSADLNVLNAETSSLNLGPSPSDNIPVSESDSRAVSVCVPEGVETVDTASLESSTSLVSMVDISKGKGNIGKPKKKKKDILKLADAQGTNSDLYNAYKGPEEKKGTPSPETPDTSSGITAKQVEKDVPCGSNKFEPDDWEDAADISTPKLDTPGNSVENDGLAKRYTRDFLLKFCEQCKELPNGFELIPEISEAVVSVNASRESYPSPGRVVDRSAARLDRRSSNVSQDDRWNRGPIGVPGWDIRIDNSYPGNVPGIRPVHGVSRHPRALTPIQYTNGILSGPMQSPGPYMQRNNSDSDKWQRASRGLPSPHTPMQDMHKAEKKYEVGKVTDAEQAKQRQLKSILNKLTPQNFEKLFDQVKQVNIDNAGTLSGVINQIFDKALMEPTFCEMYANFCSRLAVDLPDFSEDNQKITFKRLLLNKCQEEFERGEREEQEANRTEEEGEVMQTEEQREEKRIKARRRMLGNIRLIGELYKKKMLTERIMHECIKKLLGQNQNPDEENIESLCKLMTTIGAMIDHPKAKEHIDAYFGTMLRLSDNMILSSRLRFMLKDVIDMRKNKWQQRMKVEGPKKIEDVHRDIIQERHEQTTRLTRGPSFNSSLRRGPSQPTDFGQRGSNSNLLPSPNSQMGGFRGPPQQLRGYGNQDSRFDERQASENRMLLRSFGDNDSITLGPQGGLARGMSVRGQPSIQSIISEPAASRRVAPGPNGFGPREDLGSRYISERLTPQPAYGPSYVNRDISNPEQGFDHGASSSLVANPSQNVSSDKVWPEERLRDMSMQAIKEFYSARDEKEVALCIKDLNAPSYYPSMISIWVSDSFERKDVDRDSLTKLLVNLAKAPDGMLNQGSYIQGFKAVLATLEDSVNDAPRAAEYFGRILGKLLIEDVISYKEAWGLIYEGGEEQGRLVEIGLAAEVLGVILEIIKSEKGDPFLNEVRAVSNPKLEEFRPPNIKKPLRLDKFI
uniref:eukaryotic translation initiation factor 4G-like n=1 Tax=Erigeron canadensis TaxID=72917 RepID=UPI001CB9C8C9|nr:eukaryotic translation initiation factor 4G-like [Erigeron canadensis]